MTLQCTLYTSGSQAAQQCFRSLQHSWPGDVRGERLLTWNLLHHIHKAKFSLAAVDTGSLICHQLVVTPHLLSPACRQASPTPPGIAQPTQQTALNTLLSPSKNGACVLMKIQCGKASDTPVEHSVAPLFIPQYLLGTYYIWAPFWIRGGSSDKTKSQLLQNWC